MSNQLTIAKGENIQAESKGKKNAAASKPEGTLAEAIGSLFEKKAQEPLPAVDGPLPASKPLTDDERKPAGPDPLLAQILQTKRAHTSTGDTNFRMWLHSWLKANKAEPKIMAEGCIVVCTDEKSDTLFSCHIDTVHSIVESNGSVQKLVFDSTMRHIMLDPKETSSCLGADDGAGIYIMLKMILGKVPGTYIFHTGEEKGGTGSRAMRAKHPDLLDNFSRAIAFDRADNFEVICSQGGQACASIEAGEDLVKALNANGLEYEISHKGSFTDTKVYAPVIPECFNLGVGYMFQHGPDEYLDVDHLERLLNACLNIQWDKLIVKRKPMAEPAPPYSYGGARHSAGFFRGFEDEDREIYGKGSSYGSTGKSKGGNSPVKYATPTQQPKPTVSFNVSLETLQDYSRDEIIMLAEEAPETMANMMCLLLARYRGLQEEVEVLSGYFEG